MNVFSIIDRAIHEECTHPSKFRSLERLSQNICPHLFGGTVSKFKLLHIVIMVDKEIFALMCLVRLELETYPFLASERVLMLS